MFFNKKLPCGKKRNNTHLFVESQDEYLSHGLPSCYYFRIFNKVIDKCTQKNPIERESILAIFPIIHHLYRFQIFNEMQYQEL